MFAGAAVLGLFCAGCGGWGLLLVAWELLIAIASLVARGLWVTELLKL